jgi:lipid II:glycine glycyltransferase (peptidoglycan interpeptide bridge formation enzyme)
MFEQLKQNGCILSDQGGLDPINNPGGYEFRQGLGGQDIFHLGQYDLCTQPFLSAAFLALDWLRAMIRTVKLGMSRIRKKLSGTKKSNMAAGVNKSDESKSGTD